MRGKSKANIIFGLLFVTSWLSILLLPSSSANQEIRGQRVRIKVEGNQEVDLYDGSYALVIGVSDYRNGWRPLPGVKKDITEVRGALEKHGFQVNTVSNPTRSQLDNAIYGFISTYGQSAGNRLLIYFAGHGETIDSVGGRLGYIIPVDAPLLRSNNIGAFKSAAISMSHIEVYAEQIESKHALFVFDSCFSGSLFEFTRATPPAINNKTTLPVRQFITAGTAEQEVPDKSVFREQFVEGLNGEADLDKDSFVTGSELGMFLETKVTNYSREAQTPRYGKVRNPRLDKGDFVFALKKEEVAVTVSTEEVYWQGVANRGFLEEYRAYLKTYPNGKYVEVARKKIKEMDVKKWRQIQDGRNVADFESYLTLFADGEFRGLAESRIRRLKEISATTSQPASSSVTPAANYAKRGDALAEEKRWDEAQIAYRRELELEPNNVLNKFKLMLVLFAGNQNAAAFEVSRELEIANRWREVEKEIHRQKGKAINARAEYMLGYALNRQKKYVAAQEALKKAVQIDPNSADLYKVLGDVYFNQQKYVDAEAAYKETLGLNSKWASPYLGLGNIYFAQQRYAEAEAAYRKAIQLDPRWVSPHFNLGDVYYDQEKYAEAEVAYKETLQVDPKLAVTHNSLGDVYLRQRRYAEAEAAYKKALELEPMWASPHFGLGNIYFYDDKYAEAEAAYKKAIQLDPAWAVTHSMLGLTYSRQKRYAEAEAANKKAIQLDPKWWTPYIRLVDVYARQGKDSKADATDKKSRSLYETHKNYKPAMNNLEKILRDRNP